MAKEYMTKQGYEKLLAKKKELESKQKEAGLAAGEAAGIESDWHDNPAYEQAQELVRTLGRQISDLEVLIRDAVIIDELDFSEAKADEVSVGASVAVEFDGEEETYFIGGSFDSDPSKGIISFKSPLAEAILGHKVGDVVAFTTPSGVFKVKILRIDRMSI